MGNIIFYFSGTGNSFAAARQIAQGLGDTELKSITKAIQESGLQLNYERIGFVFPNYYSHMPGIVKRFIEKSSYENTGYIFGVVTMGGFSELALDQLKELISQRKGFLNAGFKVSMPGNYILKYGAFGPKLQRFILRRAERKINKIIETVRDKASKRIPKGDFLSKSTQESSIRIMNSFGENAHHFHTNPKCTGCGTCAKVCPVSNISMEDKKPAWGNTCEQCMACIQWCPVHAAEYGDKTANRTRYQHPQVKLSDMI